MDLGRQNITAGATRERIAVKLLTLGAAGSACATIVEARALTGGGMLIHVESEAAL